MILSGPDQRRLARILHLGREIEREWPTKDRHARVDLAADSRYLDFKREVEGAKGGEAESLRRLHDRSSHLHDEISLAHFYGCLVPFERLSNRALRDDEFLVAEGDAVRPAPARVPLKLIVENLRSAFNVGALFRTGECLGVSEILLTGYTPDPGDEKIARTAMGTATMVPWQRFDRGVQAVERLRSEGYRVIALETAADATSLHEFHFDARPTAFVLGNERFGVETDTLAAADAVCRIPVRGAKNSMNVGIAFGIAAFEWLRQHEAAAR